MVGKGEADSNKEERDLKEVFAALGLEEVSFLGGGLNQHWRVTSGGEEMILRRWGQQSPQSIEFERRLIARLAPSGWPVSPLGEPTEMEGALWSLAPYLPGEIGTHGGPVEQRARGRLLAELHLEMEKIDGLDQRPGWRRCEDILGDPSLDDVLSSNEDRWPEDVHVVRWHLEKARDLFGDLKLAQRPSIPVHGDFAPWNLLYQGGKLTGLIDFEFARLDHRIADFCLSWRGKYDDVIHGYEEVTPLEPEERAAIVPVWWAELIEGACRNMRPGGTPDGWMAPKLMFRSPIMGPDAQERPPL